MTGVGWAGIALVALALAYSGLVAFGAWRWSRSSGRLLARLSETEATGKAVRYSAGQLSGLPDPVRACLALTLTDGQPIVRTADLSMRGTFNMSLGVPKWKPFTSVQHVTTNRPGFVWDARIMMFPGVPIRVTDSCIGGRGMLHPALLGLFPVGDLEGDGEIAKAELMRWFAEAVWYPTALLPSQGMIWDAVDATSALATMTDGALTLSLLFRFGADGLIASVHADARAATLDGVAVMLPWVCRLSDYQTHNGMRVPMTGEVLYLTAQGERPYFRGTVTGINHTFHR